MGGLVNREEEIRALADEIHNAYGAGGRGRSLLRLARGRWEAEAERRGAEKGWDECHRASLGGFDASNPYRADRIAQGQP